MFTKTRIIYFVLIFMSLILVSHTIPLQDSYTYTKRLSPTGYETLYEALCPQLAWAANPFDVIINEWSQGNGSSKEWVELLVVNGPLDMRGWDVGDSAVGSLTFSNDTLWSSVPQGALIVIYNGGDRDGALPADDASFIDNKMVVIAHNNTTYFSGSWSTFTNGTNTDNPQVWDAANTVIHNYSSQPGATLHPGSNQSAAYLGNSNLSTDLANVANWTVQSAITSTVTPGNGNGGVNTTWITNLQNSVDISPTVASTTPNNGATQVLTTSNIIINFSEPVTVTGTWFTLTGSGSPTATVSGGPQSYTLNPTTNLVYNQPYTVTVLAAQVTDQDGSADLMAADYTFGFTTQGIPCAGPVTPIHTIQGNGDASPEEGHTHSIQGLVVGDFQSSDLRGFFIQEEDADIDADPTTSEGIFVYDNNFGVDVQPGDLVYVTGAVNEHFNLTDLNNISNITVCTPTTAVATPADFTLPLTNAAYPERFEGMRVVISQTLYVTENYLLGRADQVTLSANSRLLQPTHIAAPGAPALAVQANNNLNQIVLDDGSLVQNPDPVIYPSPGLSATNTLRGGDTVGQVEGVLTYSFSGFNGSDAYRIHPTAPVSFTQTNPRPVAPAALTGTLKIASINVLNYFNGDGQGGGFPTSRGATDLAEFTRQRDKIISAITGLDADIIGLMELENDYGDGANSAIADLVNGLNTATVTGTYAYVDPGVAKIGADEITIGLIYKPGTVALTGTTAILDNSYDAAYLDTKNRPALAQTFVQTSNQEILTVVVNHLKSKGSDCNDVGDPDTGDGQGNCNLTRTKAMTIETAWLRTQPTGVDDPDVLLIGDFNSYAQEDPITVVKNAGYTNLIEQYLGADAYSYQFDSQWGYLDHALASNSLTPQVGGVTEWHINADEPTILDYTTDYKSAGQVISFYSPDAYCASDHDPILIAFDLTRINEQKLYLPLIFKNSP